jgi:outer membrane lipoprotein-sorting protein
MIFGSACGSLQAAELTGLEVMKKVQELPQANDTSSTATLRLITAQGQERKIETTRYWKNYRGEKGFYSKTIFFTDFPPDAKGTGFLIWDYASEGKADGLWLYLPTLRKVSQVSSRDQNDAFMGSDLTFADMGERRLDEDHHQLMGTKPCNGKTCYILESTPKESDSAYSKRVYWVLADEWRTVRIDYYDSKNELLKIQTIDWQKSGDLLVFKEFHVKNVQTNHQTYFTIGDLKVNQRLRDDLFTERTLRTGYRP